MIDACYPLGSGSLLNNEEIRYSLRSLLANASNLRDVYIVGEAPAFLEFGDRLIHIPYLERHRAYRNVWEKLKVMAEDPRISEKFLYLNDDFYILKRFDAGDVPHYSRGGHLKSMKSRGKPLSTVAVADIAASYHRCLKHTLDALLRRSLPTFVFSTHQPCNFEKAKVLEVYEEFHRELQEPYGLSFRCCYGNYFRIPRVVKPTYIVKNRWQVPAGRLAFASHRDVNAALLRKKLTAMFPRPTEFERVI